MTNIDVGVGKHNGADDGVVGRAAIAVCGTDNLDTLGSGYFICINVRLFANEVCVTINDLYQFGFLRC